MLANVVKSILYVLPAYVANGSPVVGVRLLGRRTPIDLGARAWDGRRVLGDGKTIEGLIIGVSLGTLTGLILYLCGNPGGHRAALEPLLLALGAMLGDILGSFVKRRIGLRRGQPAPCLDQLGFLVAALALSSLVYGLPSWMDSSTLLLLLVVTGLLHLGTNYLAYLLGLKREPY
mgnify:CR=1 FL=1